MSKFKLFWGAVALVSMFGMMSCSSPAGGNTKPDANGEAAPTTKEGKKWAAAVGGHSFQVEDGSSIVWKFSKYGTKGSIDYVGNQTGGDNEPKDFVKVEVTEQGAIVTVKPMSSTTTPDNVLIFFAFEQFAKNGNNVYGLTHKNPMPGTSGPLFAVRKDYASWRAFAYKESFTLENGGTISFKSASTIRSQSGLAGKYTSGGVDHDLTVDVEGDGIKVTKVTFKCPRVTEIDGKEIKWEGTDGSKKITIGNNVYNEVQ